MRRIISDEWAEVFARRVRESLNALLSNGPENVDTALLDRFSEVDAVTSFRDACAAYPDADPAQLKIELAEIATEEALRHA